MAGSDGSAGMRRQSAQMRRQSAQGLFCTDEKRWAFASKEDRMIYSKKESPQAFPKYSTRAMATAIPILAQIRHNRNRMSSSNISCNRARAFEPPAACGQQNSARSAVKRRFAGTGRCRMGMGGNGREAGQPEAGEAAPGGQPTENSAFAFSIVAAAICSIGSVRTEASTSSVRKVRRGSLRLPRNGSGVI